MSCKRKLEQIDALLNVDEVAELIEVLAKKDEEERKDILESLSLVASIAAKVFTLGYDGDIEECVEQFAWDVENFEEEDK